MKLEDFDVSKDRGFLTPYDMGKVALPPVFAPVEEAGNNLAHYLLTGRARYFLDQIPEINPEEVMTLSDAQMRLLMVRYSFIVQGYVWGEKHPPEKLPRNLAVPYCALADRIGQFPLLPYTAYTLDNWVELEKGRGIMLDNIATIQNFQGGQDEDWFILDHVEIEAKAGTALAEIPPLLAASENRDGGAMAKSLEIIIGAWKKCNATFDRMPERCDPYTYFHRVRPYIHGWKDNPALPNGLVYEGVEKFSGKGQAFRGQTGSQSSIVPVMDALLGIAHENDPLREYLDELHAYRPPKHRKFIEAVRERSTVRAVILSENNKDLTELYNGCVEEVWKFRGRHLEYAASYIHKQASDSTGNPTDVGTGGTPFMRYLKKHRDESEAHKIAV